jgi:hypothetical protein
VKPTVLLQIVVLCISVQVLPVAAGAPASPVWAQADARQLWTDPVWLKLLHYAPGRGAGSWRSHADDPDFFIAQNGANNPRAELAATLNALYAPASAGNAHAQCRFVARLHWLRERLDLGALPQPDCSDYRAFRETVQATRAVLVFPSYYLNSPSSMFGHTLLRLDPADADDGAEYLSFAVNFGALVDLNDNGLFYAFKGLTGGYPGQFAVDHYYKKIREYNVGENRDIWEYPLNLTAEETERLIRHLWELRGINFAYYFFDENCSYRILELLEVARPGTDLTSAFPLTAIPIDTVRAVQQAGMTEGKDFRPAQGTELRRRLAALPAKDHDTVLALSRDPGQLDAPELQRMTATERAAVTDAAYRYLRFSQNRLARDPDAARRSFDLLRALQQQAPALADAPSLTTPSDSPDLSHGSRRLAAGLWQEDDLSYLSLGLRLSLHSLVENRTGFPQGAQINIGHLDLRIEEDASLDLERLDLVDIVSLSPRDAFFTPLSWAVQTGIDRQWTEGRQRRVPHVNGGVGVARRLGQGPLAYGLTTLRLEYNHGFADRLQPAAGLHGGLLFDVGRVTFDWSAGSARLANGQTRTRVDLRHNLKLARHHALHLEWRWQDQQPEAVQAVGLRYQYYY